jgi:hypothetical protein
MGVLYGHMGVMSFHTFRVNLAGGLLLHYNEVSLRYILYCPFAFTSRCSSQTSPPLKSGPRVRVFISLL